MILRDAKALPAALKELHGVALFDGRLGCMPLQERVLKEPEAKFIPRGWVSIYSLERVLKLLAMLTHRGLPRKLPIRIL